MSLSSRRVPTRRLSDTESAFAGRREKDFLEQVAIAHQNTVGGPRPDFFVLQCTVHSAEGAQCTCESPILRPMSQCHAAKLSERLDQAADYEDLRIMEARELLMQLDNDQSGDRLQDGALRQAVLELRDWVLIDLPPDLLETKHGWQDRLRSRIDYLREVRMIEQLDPEHRLSAFQKAKSEKSAVEREQRLSSILRKLGDQLEHWIKEKEKELAQRRSAELLGDVIVKVRTVLGNSLKALPYVLNDCRTNPAVDLTTLEKFLHGEVKRSEYSAIAEYVGKGRNRLYHRVFAPLGQDPHLRAALSDILPHAADEQGKREMAARMAALKAGGKEAAEDNGEDFASVELATAQLLALGRQNPAQVGLPKFIQQAEKEVPQGFNQSLASMTEKCLHDLLEIGREVLPEIAHCLHIVGTEKDKATEFGEVLFSMNAAAATSKFLQRFTEELRRLDRLFESVATMHQMIFDRLQTGPEPWCGPSHKCEYLKTPWYQNLRTGKPKIKQARDSIHGAILDIRTTRQLLDTGMANRPALSPAQSEMFKKVYEELFDYCDFVEPGTVVYELFVGETWQRFPEQQQQQLNAARQAGGDTVVTYHKIRTLEAGKHMRVEYRVDLRKGMQINVDTGSTRPVRERPLTEDKPVPPQEAATVSSRTVHVCGLEGEQWEDEEFLKDTFGRFGTVIDATVHVCREKERKRSPRKSKQANWGLVTFTSAEAVEKAVEEQWTLRRESGLPDLEVQTAEMATVRDVFDSIDKDGSNTLDHEEVQQAAAQLGQALTEQELSIAIYEMDKDGDGQIDFEEFVDYFRSAEGKKLEFVTLAGTGELSRVMREHQKRVEKTQKSGVVAMPQQSPSGGASGVAGSKAGGVAASRPGGGKSFKAAGQAVQATVRARELSALPPRTKLQATTSSALLAPTVVEFTEPGSLGFVYEVNAMGKLEITEINEGGQAWQKGGEIMIGHVITSVQGSTVKNSKHGVDKLTKYSNHRPLTLGLEMSAAGLSRIRKMEAAEDGSCGMAAGAANMAAGAVRAGRADGAVEEAVPPRPSTPPPPSPAAAAAPVAPVGSKLHVRGIGNGFESEQALCRVFALDNGSGGRLRVEQVTIRHRTDKTTGQNTSWALVTMESREAAETVMAARAKLPSQFTVERFSKKIGQQSRGGMRQVHHEANAKQQALRAVQQPTKFVLFGKSTGDKLEKTKGMKHERYFKIVEDRHGKPELVWAKDETKCLNNTKSKSHALLGVEGRTPPGAVGFGLAMRTSTGTQFVIAPTEEQRNVWLDGAKAMLAKNLAGPEPEPEPEPEPGPHDKPEPGPEPSLEPVAGVNSCARRSILRQPGEPSRKQRAVTRVVTEPVAIEVISEAATAGPATAASKGGAHAQPHEIYMEGYVHKRGEFPNRGFQVRWFQLDHFDLRYFSADLSPDGRSHGAEKGLLDMRDVTAVRRTANVPGADPSEINVVTKTRCWVFKCDFLEDAEEWERVLKKAQMEGFSESVTAWGVDSVIEGVTLEDVTQKIRPRTLRLGLTLTHMRLCLLRHNANVNLPMIML